VASIFPGLLLYFVPDNKTRQPQIQKYGQKRRLLRYRQIIFLAVLENYFSAEFRSISVPFRASEWALPRNSEFRRNEHFFPRVNGIRSEAIPRNLFATLVSTTPVSTTPLPVSMIYVVHRELRISLRIFEKNSKWP
jgi:hypothetical protein